MHLLVDEVVLSYNSGAFQYPKHLYEQTLVGSVVQLNMRDSARHSPSRFPANRYPARVFYTCLQHLGPSTLETVRDYHNRWYLCRPLLRPHTSHRRPPCPTVPHCPQHHSYPPHKTSFHVIPHRPTPPDLMTRHTTLLTPLSPQPHSNHTPPPTSQNQTKSKT